MRIQELEQKTGLERPTIRFYEKEGLLNPGRSENGYREYSDKDVELLKKIKLLRRLGVSVEKIPQLQQGSADLSSAIAQQVSFHSSQIEEHRRCRSVCEAMHSDGAVFATLDAEHYLKLLREIRIDDRAPGRTDFQENIPKEIHPWRRYIARGLDYSLWNGLILYILVVIIRLRPVPEGVPGTLLTIASTALFIPVEAMMLHKFGTTPGKLAMGIRLEYYQGGNLPFSEALERSWQVFIRGMGLGIPLVETCVGLYQYCRLTGRSGRRFARYDEIEEPQDMSWDASTEIIYRDWNRRRGVVLSVILTLVLLLTTGTVMDGFKPRHRGSTLTVSQIAENYNTTLDILLENADDYQKLQKDGSRMPVTGNMVIIDLNSSGGDGQLQFEYETEDGIVRSVSVHHQWDQVFYLQPLSREPLQMACSLLLAQEGCGIMELYEFIRLYESHLEQKSASFAYENLLIQWTITADLDMHQGVICGNDEENTTAAIDFRVTIR